METGDSFDGPIGARMGVLVFGVMGTIWWLAASNGVPGRWSWVFVAVGLALGAATTVATVMGTRNEGPVDAPHVRRTYNLVNAAQLAAVAVTVFACIRLQRPELISPVVAAIVGVHFLPFGPLFRWTGYRVIGGVFVLVALAGLTTALLTDAVPTTLLVTGVGCAAVLWAGAWALRNAD